MCTCDEREGCVTAIVFLLLLFAATEITPAADIYAFGLCMLEVRACHVMSYDIIPM